MTLKSFIDRISYGFTNIIHEAWRTDALGLLVNAPCVLSL